MPRQYEAMRDKFKKEGLSDKAAKAKAARIYNSRHKENPVTGKSEGKKKAGPDHTETMPMKGMNKSVNNPWSSQRPKRSTGIRGKR